MPAIIHAVSDTRLAAVSGSLTISVFRVVDHARCVMFLAMQPGPPYPPQQPGQAGGQPPYPGQPYGPPARAIRVWPAVLVLILALAVIGGGSVVFALGNNVGGNSVDEAGGLADGAGAGGTEAVAPSTTSASPSDTDTGSAAPTQGRYQTLPDCSALNGGPFTFGAQQALPQGVVVGQNCFSQAAEIDGSSVTLTANMQVFLMPDGISQAEQAAKFGDGQPVSVPGFENAPYIDFGDVCVFDYSRSNEEIELEFAGLPGVTDAASCASVAMPYAKQYYNLIG
jgi:hypothetical protein